MKVKRHTHTSLFLLPFVFFFYYSKSQSVAHFNFDESTHETFQNVLQLKLNLADQKVKTGLATNPKNLAYTFIADYIDMLKVYITDDKTLFKKLESNEKLRIHTIGSATNLKSPYIKYAQAEIHLHWALLHLKFGQYLAGFNKIKKANNLLEANAKLYPAFTPNQKSLAMIHAMMSTIPQEYKWLVKTLSGISGNMDQARFELEQVILYSDNANYIFKEEALLMYSLLVTNFDNDLQSAFTILKKSKLDPSQSPLSSYLIAHLAMKSHQNDMALKYLSDRPMSKEYFPYPYLDFLTGLVKLRKLDYSAKLHFEKFIVNNSSAHYIKECYQKLAWNELIHDNKSGYTKYINLCKTKGANTVDEDKQAFREADQNLMPNVDLLKARLLFDGGYFKEAENLIVNKVSEYDKTTTTKLEFNYRLARILHLQKKYDQTINHYLLVVKEGHQFPEYYACASALYLGQLFETLNKTSLAKTYFERCLQISPKEYSSSLHQKAKAGINRLN